MHLVAKGKPWFLAMPGPIDSEISPWQGVYKTGHDLVGVTMGG